MSQKFKKNIQYYKFCLYGFLKNLRFFDPFLFLFFLEKGLTFTQIGTLYAIREIAINLLEIPSGFISDILGRRYTLIFSFIFYIFSFIVFYRFSIYWFFILAMFLYALGDAFRTGTHKAMIFDYLKKNNWADQKVNYYGHTRSWSQFGSAISSLIAAAIVFYTGDFQTVFLFSTIPYILDLILISTYPKYLDGPQGRLKRKNIFTEFKKLLKTFLETFKNKETLKIVNSLSLHSGYFKSVKDYLQPILNSMALSIPFFIYLEDKKRSALIIGIVYFFIFLLTSFSSRKAGYAASFFNNLNSPLNISLSIGLIAGILSGIFYQLQFIFISVAAFILIYIVENLRKPIGVGHFADKVDDKILASALSAQSQAKTVYGAVIAIAIGALVDLAGIGFGLIIISSLLVFFGWMFRLREN